MNQAVVSKSSSTQLINSIANFIKKTQHLDGAIPWFSDGKLDPWDHCEAIMALTLNKDYDSAKLGFDWLTKNQNSDGSWYAQYYDNVNLSDHSKIETNFVAYPATALWHYYICTKDISLVMTYFSVIARAIDFVIAQQTVEGDIQWAISKTEKLPKDALLTACSSILRSLECAINLAEIQKIDTPQWLKAYENLAVTLTKKPWRFDRTWESKDRFSMDWFYPILSGAFSKKENALRIQQSEQRFLVQDLGCKCVSDEPWVTVAESCECVMALIASGHRKKAQALFTNLMRWQDKDGGFWTGYVYRDNTIWPEEKTTWTAAAVALAADALFDISPASKLFTSESGIYFSA